jgi:hypothetical protein
MVGGKLTCYLALVHSSLCSKHIRPLVRQKHFSSLGDTATSALIVMQVRCNHEAAGTLTFRSQYAAVTALEALDMSVLDCDVTGRFAVEVCL